MNQKKRGKPVVTGWFQDWGILQDSRIPAKTRIYLFYRSMSHLPRGVMLNSDEVAGFLGVDPESFQRQRRILVSEGLLERVGSKDRGRGSIYRACEHRVSDSGLETLSRWSPGALFCRPEDREAVTEAEKARRIERASQVAEPPRIFVVDPAWECCPDLESPRSWEAASAYLRQDSLSALWGDSEAVGATWASLKHRASENVSPALSGLDPDTRLQAILHGLALGWARGGRKPLRAADPLAYLARCVQRHGSDPRDVIPDLSALAADLAAIAEAGIAPLSEGGGSDPAAGFEGDGEIMEIVERIA